MSQIDSQSSDQTYSQPGMAISPKAQDNMSAYMASKQSELAQCSSNFVSFINADDGQSFITSVMDPVYQQAKSKLCSPSASISYVSKLVEIPDNVDYIQKKVDDMSLKVDAMSAQMNMVNGASDGEYNARKMGWSQTEYFSFIMFLLIIILIFLCGMCLYTMKSKTDKQ